MQQLEDIPDPCVIQTEGQFQEAVLDLIGAIQAAIEAKVPISKPTPFSRRWWSNELSTLKKQLNCLNNESYRYRALANHPSHAAHKSIRNEYGEAIKRAKEQHWQDFLEHADGPTIWAANCYISNPTGDGGRQRIPTLKVTTSGGMLSEVATNEEKGAVLCQLFFPPKPAEAATPQDSRYPPRVKYKFNLSEDQLRR